MSNRLSSSPGSSSSYKLSHTLPLSVYTVSCTLLSQATVHGMHITKLSQATVSGIHLAPSERGLYILNIVCDNGMLCTHTFHPITAVM